MANILIIKSIIHKNSTILNRSMAEEKKEDALIVGSGNDDTQIIGIIGGTGVGDTLEKRMKDAKLIEVDTPFGKPADKILVGTLGNNRRVAFLNRHGPGHMTRLAGYPLQQIFMP